MLIFIVAFCISCSISKKSLSPYSSSAIFAHNDYEKPIPFYQAYQTKVGYIEADIFSMRDTLFVAHEKNQIVSGRTLNKMYLDVLDSILNRNIDHPIYNRTPLTLSIDLKTEGTSTLAHLVSILNNYPKLIKSKWIKIMVSGDMPASETWHLYPKYIYFDGRPEKFYTPDQWKRILLVSSSFGRYTSWKGSGKISTHDITAVNVVIKMAHDHGKKFRFWGTPDNKMVWDFLIKNKVDVLGTDVVDELDKYLNNRKGN